MGDTIPVLDISYIFQKYNNSNEWTSSDFMEDPKIKNLVNELTSSFGTWGFLYIKGHGIPENIISQSFHESKLFFKLPQESKQKYRRPQDVGYGYVAPDAEVFNKIKPTDLKEAFDLIPNCQVIEDLSNEIPTNGVTRLFHYCTDLALKLLRLLALALGIEIDHFVKLHSDIGHHGKNGTSIRILYYPPVQCKVKEKQQRCGEHTDYGVITVLFQDNCGGLEVLSPSGKFVKVIPIKDALVVNAGDLLQAWSNGKFPATLHRVAIPKTQEGLNKARQSIAFFTHPDSTVTIDYSDKDGQWRQRNAYEHLRQRFTETIKGY